MPQRKQEETEDKENFAEDKNKENDNSDFQVYRCTIKEVVKISTYIGCKIHEYKLSKNGFCKKWKKCVDQTKKYFRSQFKAQVLDSEKVIDWCALDTTETIINL